MAKIGLIDVDGRGYPNLALMKLSAYHKRIGDEVDWCFWGHYDITYMSKVFSFGRDPDLTLADYGNVIRGGTGYNNNELPIHIDRLCPDYSIYPAFKDAYGFLTRGCPNKCSWCIVPVKEGAIRPYADIEDFLDGRKTAVLMDNNVLAHEHGVLQIEKIIKLKIKVDFNQGLDARLIDRQTAKLLSKVKWLKPLRMACDTDVSLRHVKKATRYLREYNCTPRNYFIYVLVKEIDSAYRRVRLLDKWGLDPFAQPYRDFVLNKPPTKEQKRFARWVNHKAIFRSVEYKNYK